MQVCECSVVVMLECSEEVMLGRLKRRGETSGRVDDNDATIRKRMATFSKSTLPVIQHYQVLGKVKLVSLSKIQKTEKLRSPCGTLLYKCVEFD